MRKRWLPWIVATVIAVSGGTLVAPVASSASGSVTGFYDLTMVQVNPDTGERTTSVPVWGVAGDCTIYPDQTVVLTPPDATGQAWAAWHATTFTSSTGNADIWRGTFLMLNADGNLLAVVPMQSPPMTATYTQYTFDYYQPFDIEPYYFSQITQMEWYAVC